MDSILVNSFLLGDSFKDIFAYFSLRTLQLTLKHGLSALYAPMAVISWGSFHAAMGTFDKALEAEQVAIQIIKKLNAQCIKGRAILTSHATIHFWRHMLN
jgi:predicted ATPase